MNAYLNGTSIQVSSVLRLMYFILIQNFDLCEMQNLVTKEILQFNIPLLLYMYSSKAKCIILHEVILRIVSNELYTRGLI